MRLIRLYVEKYRVLEKLNIEFGRSTMGELAESLQPGYRLDFLVGLNGSGKSTVLHLLSRIFKNILLDEGSFPVTIELEYIINGNIVTISNRLPEQAENELNLISNLGGSLRYQVHYAEGKYDEGQTRLPAELRPDQVIIYTTGGEAAWLRELSKGSNDELIEDILLSEDKTRSLYEISGHQYFDMEKAQDDDANPQLIFIPSQRLPLITLCGLIASRKYNLKNENLQPVLSSMNLEKLVGFSLRLRPDPEWTDESRPDIVNKLEEAADHQIQQGADRLFVFNFDRSESDLHQILDMYATPIEIFQRLNSLCETRPYHTAPLREVNLFFRAMSVDGSTASQSNSKQSLYLYDWLSDGEQSFLGRMALFSLFRADNLLIMLDEPEVHFNDAWKREIVNMLHDIMKQQSSHALITTHSSIALTDVPKESIIVLRREQGKTGGQNAATSPTINTLGADPSDVLVHVFGTGTATGRRSTSYIGAKIADSNSVSDLQKLEDIVAPGYWRYRIELEKQRLQRPRQTS